MNPENLTLLVASNLPAGSVIEDVPDYDGDRPSALTKRDDGRWTCDECGDPHMLYSIYRGDETFTLKSLGELPEGFVFGTSNLGLSKFAPEGTLVSDPDGDGSVWERIGNYWINGVTHKDRAVMAARLAQSAVGLPGHSWPLAPIWAPYTVIAPEKEIENEEGLSAEDATELKDKVLKDREGDLWRFHDGEWQFSNSSVYWRALSFSPNELDKDFEPYEVVEDEKAKGLTVEDLLERPDRLYYDSDGDLWGSRDGRWAWEEDLEALDRKLSGEGFRHTEPFEEGEPYRVAEGVSLHGAEPEPEEEKVPTPTESWRSIAVSLERIANALENK